jgi:hypothetical protein
MSLKTRVKCNKNLVHSDGTQSFTKGQIYEGNICNVLENLRVTNNQNEPHVLSMWHKHFKVIK